jgi:hypothetical protein
MPTARNPPAPIACLCDIAGFGPVLGPVHPCDDSGWESPYRGVSQIMLANFEGCRLASWRISGAGCG